MIYDPDNPSAHADARAPNARRGPATDAERRAADNLPNVALAGTLKGWDLTFAESASAQIARYGPSFSDAQWKHVLRIGRIAAPKPAPARTSLEEEASEVEAQLDAVLRDPAGDRCVLANDEAGTGRSQSIARALGLGPGGDGPLAGTPRLPEYAFGVCGTCFIGPSRGCTRCAAGTPHPALPCDSPHRSKVCRGIAYLATLRARILDAAGQDGNEVRRDMGLEVTS